MFDILAFSRKLQQASFTPAQSDAVHEAIRGSVAIKADLDLAVEKLRAEMLLLKWMMGFVLAGIAGLVAKAFF